MGPGTSTNSDWRIKERLDENGLGQRTERLAKRVRSLYHSTHKLHRFALRWLALTQVHVCNREVRGRARTHQLTGSRFVEIVATSLFDCVRIEQRPRT